MAQFTIVAPLPSDGITTYQRWLIERAPNSGGVPGAYAQIVNQELNAYNENQSYTDSGGAIDSWYRYRYANTALDVFSNYSDDTQAGQYTVKSWLQVDIPDADITSAMWDQWKDMAIQEFRGKGIGRPVRDPISITPESTTDEMHDLPAEMRNVIRMDVYYGSNWITSSPQFHQWGRQIRIFKPVTTLTYKLWGIGEIRSLADIDDEMFPLLYWYMRMKYLDFRLHEREQTRAFLTADKVSDVKTEQLLEIKLRDTQVEYKSRVAEAQENWPLATGAL
jgi:hypothetical protein